LEQKVVQFHEVQTLIDQLDPAVYNRAECNEKKYALKSLINLQVQQEKIFNQALASQETKQNIVTLLGDYNNLISQLATQGKPLVEETELYNTLTTGLQENTQRRLVGQLQAIKLKHLKGMNKDVRFLIDFSTRQLMKLEESRNLSEERRTQVEKEINEEIRDLE